MENSILNGSVPPQGTTSQLLPPYDGRDNAPNPFDPETLRIDINDLTDAAVEKVVAMIKVDKPSKQEFFRVHRDPAFVLSTTILDYTAERSIYLVAPQVRPLLAGVLDEARLYAAITQYGVPFLLPAKAWTSGNGNSWLKSRMAAVELAKSSWVRMIANIPAGAYDVERAVDDLGEPDWPDMLFPKWLEIAFRDRMIDHEDHPVIKTIQGRL